MCKFLKFCWDTIGVLLQIKDIVFLFVGVTGGGVAVLTFLKQLPPYIPIIIEIIAIGLITFEIFKMRMVYKMWNKLLVEKKPLIEKIMRQLLDMHLKLKETTESYFKESITKKQTETVLRLWLKPLGIKERQITVFQPREIRRVGKLISPLLPTKPFTSFLRRQESNNVLTGSMCSISS
jgi:hypothetical protein